MTFKNLFLAAFYTLLFTANVVFSQDADFSPVKVRLVRASYSKITISWQPGSSPARAAYYKVLRDDNEVGTSTALQYTDENLQNGTEYIYRIIAVSPSEENSPASVELRVKTIKSETFDHSNNLELAVDQLHNIASFSNAATLIAIVKSGLETLLNTNIALGGIDSDIIDDYVAEELALIQQSSTGMTDAEYQIARAELNDILNEEFGGNSFEHVYIYGKLTQLAEKHWQQGHKNVAKALYSFSLKYLNDQEKYVFNVLSRLAEFELAEITSESSNDEAASALNAHYSQYCRFFDFFADSTSRQALYTLRLSALIYFKHFPRLLDYSVYNKNVFYNARQAAQAALDMADENDINVHKLFERIDAWELVNQKLTFLDSDGNPATGTLTVKNITAGTDKKYYFYDSEAIPEDERQFTVTDGEVIVPAYKGHIYETTFCSDIAGSNPIKFTTVGLTTTPGKILIYK